MPTTITTSPELSPEDVRLFTLPQRHVLAHLFAHGTRTHEELVTSDELHLGSGTAHVLRDLALRRLVVQYSDGWDLNPVVRDLMTLGHRVQVLGAVEGSR